MFKSKVFLAALMALSLIGCSKIDANLNVENEDEVISFMRATKVAQTKATTTAFDKSKTFNVYGLYSGDFAIADIDFSNLAVYMNNVKIAYNSIDSEWKSEDTYYWPKTGKLSFIGYAPSSANIALGSSMSSLLNYEDYVVTSTYADQTEDEDLLISKLTKDVARTTSPVYIEFKHALSQVRLSFKAATTTGGDVLKYYVVVENIAINDIFKKGDFSHNSESNVNVWDVDTSADRVNSGDIFNNDSEGQSINATYVSEDGELSLISNYFGTSDKAYYVMPQVLDGEMVLHVEYTIYTCNTQNVILSVGTYSEDIPLSTFGSKTLEEWISGKSYTYNITINPASNDIITFDPYVVDWDEEYSADVDPEDNEDAESEEEEESNEESEEESGEVEEQQGDNENEGDNQNQGSGDNENEGNNQGDNQQGQGSGDNENEGGKNNNGNGNNNGQNMDDNNGKGDSGKGNNSGKGNK